MSCLAVTLMMFRIALTVLSFIAFLFFLHEVAFRQSKRWMLIFALVFIGSIAINFATPCTDSEIQTFKSIMTRPCGVMKNNERIIYG